MQYEFKCSRCGETTTQPDRLLTGTLHPCPDWTSLDSPNDDGIGEWKRVWSVGFNIKSVDWSH